MGSQLNDMEFEEILQRNKTVSSSAISRAVQDASVGEFVRLCITNNESGDGSLSNDE